MKRACKFLFIVLVIMACTFVFSANVKAADEIEYAGYEELGEEKTANTEEKKETKEETKNEEQKTEAPKAEEQTKPAEQANKANTATKPHETAGSFEVVYLVSAIVIVGAVLAIGYSKFKKYNY